MDSPRPADTRNLVAACAAITVFGFAFGMSYPLLSLILESRGVSSDMIGINSAMMPIGILLFSSVIPVAAKRFGARKVAITAAIVTGLVILSYKVFDTLAAWFLIRLVQGMAISTLFVLSESWIVGSAGDQEPRQDRGNLRQRIVRQLRCRSPVNQFYRYRRLGTIRDRCSGGYHRRNTVFLYSRKSAERPRRNPAFEYFQFRS